MRRALVVLLLPVLVACGGSGEPAAESSAPASESPTASTAAGGAGTSLVETCPKVETTFREVGEWAAVPTMEQAGQLMDELSALAKAGDEETRNALAIVRDPIDMLWLEAPAPGRETVDASAALDSAIGTFAGRCASVGSGAFQ